MKNLIMELGKVKKDNRTLKTVAAQIKEFYHFNMIS